MKSLDKLRYKKITDYSRHQGGLETYLGEILGKKFTEYRAIWKKVTNREIITDFPCFVVFETKFCCNFKCIMCHKSDLEITRQIAYPETIPMGLFKRIVDECAEYKCPSMSLNNNNEPLLDKMVIKKLSYASREGIIDIMMNTNAVLLNEDVSKALIDNGLTRLLISLDAVTEKTFTKVRSIHYNKVVKNIEKFLKIREESGSKLPVLRLSFVVINLNEAEQDNFLKIWKDKADQVSFQRYTPPAKKNRFLELYPVSREEMHFSCSQPFERLIIRGNGDVYPCCYQSIQKSLGNVKEKSLHEIWHSAELNEYRRIVMEEDWDANQFCNACSDCR